VSLASHGKDGMTEYCIWAAGEARFSYIILNSFKIAGSQAPAWEPTLGSSSFPLFRLFTKPSISVSYEILMLKGSGTLTLFPAFYTGGLNYGDYGKH
jgi:hypothetical protein